MIRRLLRTFALPALLIPFAALAGNGTIAIFHTNDTHAAFTPSEATWRDDRPLIGGFAALQAHLREEREKAGPSLYIDAGDFMTGNPISNIEVGGVKGGALLELFGEMGLDAMALGNHEFDHPRANTLGLIEKAPFPILAANLRYEKGGFFTGKGYVIRQVGDVRVGIIGITPDDLNTLISRSAYEGLEVSPAVQVLKEIVPEVDASSDLIVVLSHLGIGGDRILAREVEGIDIIVGGHSHTRLDRGEWVGDVLIVQAGSKMRYLGRIDLDVEDDRATDVRCRLVPLWTAGYDGSAKVDSMVSRFGQDIQEEYGKVIARSEATLGRSSDRESALGNWLTDRLRAVTGADVAFLNSGGIRNSLAEGEVTKLDILEILPFSNAVCTFECTGEELIAIVESNLLAGVTGDHGVLQSSGLVVSWGQAGDKVWVSDARLGDPGDDAAPAVDPERKYTVATVDYVAISQPEKYLGFRPADVQGAGTVLTDAIMEDVERTGTIARPAGRRMIQQKSVEPAGGTIESAG